MLKRKSPPDGSGPPAIDVSGRDLSSTASEEAFLDVLRQHCGPDANLSAAEALEASRCRLGPAGTSALLSFLSSDSSPWPSLKRLRLQRNAMGSAGGRAVGKFLSHNATVEALDISLNDLKAGGGEPTAPEIIADALRTNATLQELVLEKCAVGPEGATHLAGALRGNQSLKVLEVAGNMIGPVGGEALFRALKSNASLESLGLRMNRIGGGSAKMDVRSLSEALAGGGCRLVKLDLSYNDLRCSGCVILSEALQDGRCTLEELRLEKNDVATEGAVALAKALGSNSTLRKIALKGNGIGDGGAIALGAMLKQNNSLRSMDISSCSIGNNGGVAIGHGLAQNSTLEYLDASKNSLGAGTDATIFSVGISSNQSLKELCLSGNGFGASGDPELWGTSISEALSGNTSIQRIDLSNNSLSDAAIVDAVVGHPHLEFFDLSDNEIETVTIETQLLLAKRLSTLELDLSLNPLSSPPLGRLADHANLRKYLSLLASEKTEVTRIRLMVLGYGGVGKSTFCRAVTNEAEARSFQSTLVPVEEWGVDRVADWAGRLGTPWAGEAVRLVVDECVAGKELAKLVDATTNGDKGGSCSPSKLLVDLCSSKYSCVDATTFARAISALCAKGYLSTVGAVKVEGTIQLGTRTCSLVDFAGQVEFLVSHQLLLSSMHTLCMIIQPAPSFGKPGHRHFGSWDYWSKFLASLGDRRRGSLLLAVSQLDKLPNDDGSVRDEESFVRQAFASIKERSLGAVSCAAPLQLDYCPNRIGDTILSIKGALSKSTEEVSRSWWVPLTYETLSDIVQRVAERKSSNHELPILTKSELMQEMDAFCEQSIDSSALMAKMKTDPKLLQRAISYLEAVGDVMQAADEWLLVDPIGWFSSFLSHFIKDDLAVSTIQVDSTSLRRQRGTVNLDVIVSALKHEYRSPREHIEQIMRLLCGLELCIPLKTNERKVTSTPEPTSYLFPCLLPPLLSQSELDSCVLTSQRFSSTSSIRGHRFREVSGFIPPGLFVGILARMYERLQQSAMNPSRMWKDHAILEFNHKSICVLLRVDLDKAIIDVIGWAPTNEQIFVGAAKGQASIVTWVVHLIKMYLRTYSQLRFEESWLCPSPLCHGADDGYISPSYYTGSEFLLSAKQTHRSKSKYHDCIAEGCWRFLGTGHSLERTLRAASPYVCQTCQSCTNEPIFALRDRIS